MSKRHQLPRRIAHHKLNGAAAPSADKQADWLSLPGAIWDSIIHCLVDDVPARQALRAASPQLRDAVRSTARCLRFKFAHGPQAVNTRCVAHVTASCSAWHNIQELRLEKDGMMAGFSSADAGLLLPLLAAVSRHCPNLRSIFVFAQAAPAATLFSASLGSFALAAGSISSLTSLTLICGDCTWGERQRVLLTPLKELSALTYLKVQARIDHDSKDWLPCTLRHLHLQGEEVGEGNPFRPSPGSSWMRAVAACSQLEELMLESLAPCDVQLGGKAPMSLTDVLCQLTTLTSLGGALLPFAGDPSSSSEDEDFQTAYEWQGIKTATPSIDASMLLQHLTRLRRCDLRFDYCEWDDGGEFGRPVLQGRWTDIVAAVADAYGSRGSPLEVLGVHLLPGSAGHDQGGTQQPAVQKGPLQQHQGRLSVHPAFPRLTTLTPHAVHKSAFPPGFLSALPQLRLVRYSNWRRVCPLSLEELLAACPHFKKLDQGPLLHLLNASSGRAEDD